MKIKKKILLIVFLLLSIISFPQGVAINTDGTVADGSAMLDVKSTNKGILIPRISIPNLSAAAPVTAPINSLLVYNTNAGTGVGYYYWTGTQWMKLISTSDLSTDGLITCGTANYVVKSDGTNGVCSQIFDNGTNVGIGTASPAYKLDVNGYLRVNSTSNPGRDYRIQCGSRQEVYTANDLTEYINGNKCVITGYSGGANNDFYIASVAEGTKYFTAEGTNQRIGIGNIDPSQKLHVTGNLRVTGAYYDSNNTSGTSGQVLSSTATGTTWTKGQIISTNSADVTAGNWYRIASNPGNRADATFTLRDFISGGGHSTMRFHAGVNYGNAGGISFTLLNHSIYGSATFTKVRIVRNGTYDGAYLEVYCNRTGTVEYDMFDNYQSSGWVPVDWTVGSIPGGWTAHEYETDRVFAVGISDDVLSLNRSGYLGVGTANPTYRLESSGDIYANGGWMRVSGNQGYYFESWGGGFYMTDATWIRTYNNKSFYHNTGTMRTDGTFQVGGSGSTLNVPNGGNFAYRTNVLFANTSGNVGVGTATPAYRLDLASGTFGFGNANQRTETRDNAGLQGNAGAQSGFFETATATPGENYPVGATSYWHLIDCRHSNTTNNYAMQFAGSFYDQKLYFRKTNGNAAQAWTEVLTGDYFDTNVVTVESTSTLSITSGTFTVIPGESITINNLAVGDRVIIWFGGNMSIDPYDWNIVDVALFINGTMATVGGFVRTSIDNDYAYIDFVNYFATARYYVSSAGNYTFDVRARRYYTGNTIYIGGNSTDSREGVLTVFVIKN